MHRGRGSQFARRLVSWALQFVRVALSHSALLLNSVMWAFRAEFVATRATDFITMIKDCDEAGFPKVSCRPVDCTCKKRYLVSPKAAHVPLPPPSQHLLFGSLGRSLACADPPENERLSILNEAWKVITKVRGPQVRPGPQLKIWRCRHV